MIDFFGRRAAPSPRDGLDPHIAKVREHDRAYRVDRVLAEHDGQVTEVVRLGNEGPYLRKRMRAETTSVAAWERLREAESEHLPRLIDLYGLPGEVVAVTSYVDGESLVDLVDRVGPLDVPEAARIACDVADAAQALHDVGVVHRDITPGNVMVGEDGAHLVDLGISRLVGTEQGEPKRRDTHILGTYGFAPPEQYGFAATDARSDVWSLGRLLAFMLTGLYPDDERFEGACEDPAIVPPAFRSVIDRACSLEPSARPRDANRFAAEVREALDECGHRGRTRRKRRRILVVAAICAVAVIALVATSLGFGFSTEREPVGAAALIAEAERQAGEAEGDAEAGAQDDGLEGSENGNYGAWYELGSQMAEQFAQGIRDGGTGELGSQSGQDSTSGSDSGTSAPVDMPFRVTVDSARLVKDYKGDLAALLTIDFANGSDETTNFSSQFDVTAFQDGKELRPTGSPDFDLESVSDRLRPGASTTCYELFELTSRNPIEVEVTYYADYAAGPFLTKTFDL